MIAEVLKDDIFGFEEMAEILFTRNSRLRTPDSRQAALLRRIKSRTEVPPFALYEGQYYFPKESFREWALKRPVLQEVRRVG